MVHPVERCGSGWETKNLACPLPQLQPPTALETRPTFDTPLYAQSGNDLIGIPKSFDWCWTINYQFPKLVKSDSVSVSAIVQFPWEKNTSSSSLTSWLYCPNTTWLTQFGGAHIHLMSLSHSQFLRRLGRPLDGGQWGYETDRRGSVLRKWESFYSLGLTADAPQWMGHQTI
jgi:hypothetical protein